MSNEIHIILLTKTFESGKCLMANYGTYFCCLLALDISLKYRKIGNDQPCSGVLLFCNFYNLQVIQVPNSSWGLFNYGLLKVS